MNRSERAAEDSGPHCRTLSQNASPVLQLQSQEIVGRGHDNRPDHEAMGWSFDRDEPGPMIRHSTERLSQDNAPKVSKPDVSHLSNGESSLTRDV